MNATLRKSRLPIVLATLSILAACQSTTSTGGISKAAVCSIFPPITYSSRDTAETVTQIRRNNAAFDAYCG